MGAATATKGQVLSAIKSASDRTGVDFTYLVNKAAQESSLNPTAKAAGSSATGLYQFIDQTWLKTIKENGADYGLSEAADKITIGSDGVARVANAADRKAILDLRRDPKISADMAAELAKDNKAALEKSVGGKVGPTEMYLAHFLGSGGASSLINELKTNPNAKAADILPTAAAANKSVFYNKETGEARTVGEIYQRFAKKFDKMPDLGGMDTQVASATTTKAMPSAQSVQDIQDQLATSLTTASLSNSSSTVTLANGVSLHNTTASPFATMVLAQMDMETFGLDAKDYASKFGSSNDERRKSVLTSLANAG